MLNDQEIADRRHAVENAIATQRLEGLEIDATTRAEMDRYARGEIEIDEILQSVRRRVAAGEFRQDNGEQGNA